MPTGCDSKNNICFVDFVDCSYDVEINFCCWGKGVVEVGDDGFDLGGVEHKRILSVGVIFR